GAARGCGGRRGGRGAGVAVGEEDGAKPAAGEGAAVIDERVADDALAHAHGSDGVEGEGAEVERGRQQYGPARSPRDQALGDGLGEVAGGGGGGARPRGGGGGGRGGGRPGGNGRGARARGRGRGGQTFRAAGRATQRH